MREAEEPTTRRSKTPCEPQQVFSIRSETKGTINARKELSVSEWHERPKLLVQAAKASAETCEKDQRENEDEDKRNEPASCRCTSLRRASPCSSS